ncbi:MAG: c-type cytochrome [Longimicrobiales bacterium]
MLLARLLAADSLCLCSMFQPFTKKVMLSVLVVCFAIQTGLVYSDSVDLTLSEDAVEGRKLFHDGSCQVCHQLWGQGGFLGPDLTNAASRLDETRLVSLLTVGSGQMPAFNYSPEQIGHLRAFLEEIDRPDLGRGQLRLGDPDSGTTPQAAFENAVSTLAPAGAAGAGFDTFRSGICSTCHFPFQRSIVGAPDLSTAVERVSDEELRTVLTDGRPALGMPPPIPAFSENQKTDLIAWFHWLNENRVALESETDRRMSQRSVDWSRLDWWEFR